MLSDWGQIDSEEPEKELEPAGVFSVDDDIEDDSVKFWIRMVKAAIKNLETSAPSRTRLNGTLLGKGSRQANQQKQDEYLTAVHWLFLSNDTDLGSFQWVCDLFEIDIDAARVAILAKKYGSQNARSMLALYKKIK